MFALNPTMKGNVFLCVLVVTSLLDFVLTDSDVIIQNTNISYVCGRSMTLTCKFKKNTTVTVWTNEDDIIPIAECAQHSCRLNPDYDGQFNISFDMTEYIFNLTIIKVTMNDNGRKLVCSDGTNSDSRIIRVRAYEPRLIEDEIVSTIKATSGCISQDKQVSFEWIKISASSKVESTINRNITYNYTNCSTDSECGHDHNREYTEIIYAKPSENGNYYLKIAMIYENERIESRKSALKYAIEEEDNKNDKSSDIQMIVILFVITTAVGLLGSICVRKILKSVKRNRDGHTQSGKDKGEETDQMLQVNMNNGPGHRSDEQNVPSDAEIETEISSSNFQAETETDEGYNTMSAKKGVVDDSSIFSEEPELYQNEYPASQVIGNLPVVVGQFESLVTVDIHND